MDVAFDKQPPVYPTGTGVRFTVYVAFDDTLAYPDLTNHLTCIHLLYLLPVHAGTDDLCHLFGVYSSIHEATCPKVLAS